MELRLCTEPTSSIIQRALADMYRRRFSKCLLSTEFNVTFLDSSPHAPARIHSNDNIQLAHRKEWGIESIRNDHLNKLDANNVRVPGELVSLLVPTASVLLLVSLRDNGFGAEALPAFG